MKKITTIVVLSVLLSALMPLHARDFTYTYEGQTITYTVLDEEAKTCATKAGIRSGIYHGPYPLYSSAGNKVSGNLVLPTNPIDDDVKYTLVEIGEGSFSVNELTSVTIPNTVQLINISAFQYCSDLVSIKIPESVQTILLGAFEDCTGLSKAEFASIEHLCNIFFFGGDSNPLYYAKHLFINGEEIIDLVIPETVTDISDGAFVGCNNLKSVKFGSSVSYIGGGAFSGCSGLTSITIPNSVTEIGYAAFSGCDNIQHVEFTSIEHLCRIYFEYVTSNPLYYAKHLFINGEEIIDLVIPDSITTIGQYAFSYCNNLRSVVIGNTVSGIGTEAFSHCTNLSSVAISNSVETIGDYAFSSCSNLTSLIIPNSVTEIGESAFWSCIGLTELTIPNSVTKIGYGAFSGCTGLTSVIIPNSVTEIGKHAFSDCRGLTTINIPNSVISIGDRAFYNCSGLTSVYYNTDSPIEGDIYTFYDDNSSKSAYAMATLYMPAKGLEKAKEIAPWKHFRRNQEYDFGGVTDVIADKAGEIDYTHPYEIYNFNGAKVGDNK
ncbi:MAG: leucine-rich repeat domain-containing protein, partial [Muribaculaceae bacterium]|nr:leucine-rich repeat domain-containing protein [Muribaculaceae bacterium]